MKKLIFLSFLLINSSIVLAEHLDLDQLLRQVKQTQGKEARINKAREAQFLKNKNNQQQLLQNSVLELTKQENLSSKLKVHLDSNEAALSQLETELKNRSGELGELFGVAKQAAGDLKADLLDSIISAQFPDRTEKLTAISTSKALPTIDQLESLWYTLQHEMTESGKVVHFDSQVQMSGELKQAKVVRVGSFNALTNGQYLEFLPDTKRFNLLDRQPDSKYLAQSAELMGTHSGMIATGIDPTRGVILSMLIKAPDQIERIKQGGVIGYIILVLGAIGFIYAIIRWFQLASIGTKMKNQLTSSDASQDNPLGRIILSAEQEHTTHIENLELVLDEAITREVPFLEKGLPMIKLLAAVAPLLGLLGTVTGMIATFQSISLFGTGDPKLMASGISQALVTTMLGLCVAIPLLFLHSLVASRSRTLIQILDEQSAGLISKRATK